MNQHLDIQDLSIVLAVKNHTPAVLTLDFLVGSGIVPLDWELARPSSLSARGAEVVFKNGVRIVAQPGTVTFLEGMGSTVPETLEISQIAHKYAAALPHLEYQGVGINPRRFVAFDQEPNAAHQYLTERLLGRGSWQTFGTAPMQAGLNLVYTLEQGQLRLGINEARLQLPDRESVPAIVFAGNFHYAIDAQAEEPLQLVLRAIDSWREDVVRYQELIDQHFLAGVHHENVSVIPSIAV